MKRYVFAALAALASLSFGASVLPGNAAAEQTVRVIVMAQDGEDGALNRHQRVQKDVLNAFIQVLQAPAASDIARKYGLQGFDVYEERAISQAFVPPNATGRTEDEVIATARAIKDPRLDLVVMYAVFAEAVPDPYIKGVSRLRGAVRYRVLDLRSGRQISGDNLDLDPEGVPMTGCAGGVGQKDAAGNSPKVYPMCVYDFVAAQIERLVRDAGSTIALQVAAMATGGRADAGAGTPAVAAAPQAGGYKDTAPAVGGPVAGAGVGADCDRLPTEYKITFKGMTQPNVRLLFERMSNWGCGLDVGLASSSLSETSYTYKVRATEAVLKYKLELTLEALGLTPDVKLIGHNELAVTAIAIRTN